MARSVARSALTTDNSMTYLVDAKIVSEPTKAAPSEQVIEWLRRNSRRRSIRNLTFPNGKKTSLLQTLFDERMQRLHCPEPMLKSSKKKSPSVALRVLNDRPLQILLAAGILALLVSVIFYVTYPINIGQSDNPTYVRMIVLGSSNLMHASGYPAVVYLLSNGFMPPYSSPLHVSNDINNRWFSTLQTVQFALHLGLFWLSVFLCTKLFGKPVAAILALLWGSNILFISNVNATAPEWLQGHAILLSILTHAYAGKTSSGMKPVIYSLGTAVFALAYLIKPNALMMAFSLIVFLAFDRKTWRFKALQAAASTAIFLALTSAFAHTYHYKATGTTHLNFDHAWVLSASLPTDYWSTYDELGVNSLRWAALLRITPPDYSRAGGIEHVNFGAPLEIRQQYAVQAERIFRMSKEELVQAVKANPLPAGFSQWYAAVSLYYYFGLQKTDALGIKVYIESLQSHPGFYARKIVKTIMGFLASGLKTIQTFPTLSNPIGYKFLPPDFVASAFGTSMIVPPTDRDPLVLEYYNPRKTVWYYGVRVIEFLNRVTSAGWLYLALNIAALAGLFKLRWGSDKIAALSLLTGLLAFASGSGMLAGLRHKELTAIAPAYCLLLSIGLIGAARWSEMARTLWSRNRPTGTC